MIVLTISLFCSIAQTVIAALALTPKNLVCGNTAFYGCVTPIFVGSGNSASVNIITGNYRSLKAGADQSAFYRMVFAG